MVGDVETIEFQRSVAHPHLKRRNNMAKRKSAKSKRISLSVEDYEYLGKIEKDKSPSEALKSILGVWREFGHKMLNNGMDARPTSGEDDPKDRRIQELEASHDRLYPQIDQLENKLQTAETELASEKRLHSAAGEKITRLESEITQKDGELETARNDCNTLEAELRRSASDLENSQTEQARLQGDLDTCAGNLLDEQNQSLNYVLQCNDMEVSRNRAYCILFGGYLVFAAIYGYMAYRFGWVGWW